MIKSMIGSSEPFLSGQELAKLLGMTRPTITEWVKKGCPHIQLTQAYRFRLSEVLGWIEEQKAERGAWEEEQR